MLSGIKAGGGRRQDSVVSLWGLHLVKPPRSQSVSSSSGFIAICSQESLIPHLSFLPTMDHAHPISYQVTHHSVSHPHKQTYTAHKHCHPSFSWQPYPHTHTPYVRMRQTKTLTPTSLLPSIPPFHWGACFVGCKPSTRQCPQALYSPVEILWSNALMGYNNNNIKPNGVANNIRLKSPADEQISRSAQQIPNTHFQLTTWKVKKKKVSPCSQPGLASHSGVSLSADAQIPSLLSSFPSQSTYFTLSSPSLRQAW